MKFDAHTIRARRAQRTQTEVLRACWDELNNLGLYAREQGNYPRDVRVVEAHSGGRSW